MSAKSLQHLLLTRQEAGGESSVRVYICVMLETEARRTQEATGVISSGLPS